MKISRSVLIFVSLALLGVVGYFAYNLMLMFNPGLEPHSFEERSVARAAAKHLRHDSHVSSVQVFEEESYNSGDAPTVSVHLKDGISTDTATALLSSTRDKALGDDDGSTQIAITLKWSVEGTDINVFFLISASSYDIATNVQHDLSPVGEAKSIQRPGETSPLQVDYGDVTTPPSSLTTPSGSSTIKTFTMNGWHVTSTSNTDGQFSNPPLTSSSPPPAKPAPQAPSTSTATPCPSLAWSPTTPRTLPLRQQPPLSTPSPTAKPQTDHAPAQQLGTEHHIQRRRPLADLHLQQRHLDSHTRKHKRPRRSRHPPTRHRVLTHPPPEQHLHRRAHHPPRRAVPGRILPTRTRGAAGAQRARQNRPGPRPL